MRQCSKNAIVRAVLGAVLVISPWVLKAQSTSCPIQPTQVKDTSSQLVINFKNLSGKTTASYRFALTFFDLNGHPHKFPQPLIGNVQMASHANRTAIWHTPLATNFLYPYAQASLQQVTFTDGTFWLDDGSQNCSIMSVQE